MDDNGGEKRTKRTDGPNADETKYLEVVTLSTVFPIPELYRYRDHSGIGTMLDSKMTSLLAFARLK